MNEAKKSSFLNMDRRDFLKTAAGGALAYCLAGIPGMAMAEGAASERSLKSFKITPAGVRSLPEPVRAAELSDMVRQAYNSIVNRVDTIRNETLREQVQGLIKDPLPSVGENYTTSGEVSALYRSLANAGFLDTAKVPEDKLVPPFTGKAPQQFYTAPGSGYHSHHAYPGGLATHVGTNMLITDGIINTYEAIYGYDPGHDAALAGQALHDIAKPWVFQWQPDGSSLTEYTIAGTGAHHIYSIAEVMYRSFPADVVVALACAHNHPGNAASEADVVGWLKAGAIIAGRNPVQYGVLEPSGEHIPTPHKQAGFIVHLGDHDWVLSVPASQQTEPWIENIAKTDYGISDQRTLNYFRNYVGAQLSFMKLYHLGAEINGPQQIRTLIGQVVTL